MAAASRSQSEAETKKARLRAIQESETARLKQAELTAKEREKRERWEKVIENHEKKEKEIEKSSVKDVKPPAPAPKPKILQQVYHRKHVFQGLVFVDSWFCVLLFEFSALGDPRSRLICRHAV